MKSFLSARALVVMAVVGTAFMACGGSIEQGSDGSSGGISGKSSGDDSDSGSSGGNSNRDAGSVSSDGGGNTCVDIKTADFDTSCHVDNDCIQITTGHLCGGDNCFCGGSTINIDGQTRYDDHISSLPTDGLNECACPFFGTPTCAEGTCAICPPPGSGLSGPPGCPDAGP